jgi:hypothetical protein
MEPGYMVAVPSVEGMLQACDDVNDYSSNL